MFIITMAKLFFYPILLLKTPYPHWVYNCRNNVDNFLKQNMTSIKTIG